MSNRWIIRIQRNWYYTNFCKENGVILDNNFSDVVVFENMDKDEVQKIAHELLKDMKSFWDVTTYEEALKDYYAENYIENNGIKYGIKEYIELKEAIINAREGRKVLCIYNGNKIIFGKDFPDKLDVDIILDAKWRNLYRED